MGCGASKAVSAPDRLRDDSTSHVRETNIPKLSKSSLPNDSQKPSDSVTNGKLRNESKTTANDSGNGANGHLGRGVSPATGKEGHTKSPRRLPPLKLEKNEKVNETKQSTENVQEGSRNSRKIGPTGTKSGKSETLLASSNRDPSKSCNGYLRSNMADRETAECIVKVRENGLVEDPSLQNDNLEDHTHETNSKGDEKDVDDQTQNCSGKFENDVVQECGNEVAEGLRESETVFEKEKRLETYRESGDLRSNRLTKQTEAGDVGEGFKASSVEGISRQFDITGGTGTADNRSDTAEQYIEVSEMESFDPKTHYAALLSQLLLDIGYKTLKRKFDSFHPPESLRASLKSRYKMLLALRSKRLLKPKHWGKLFPQYPAQPDSNTFDLTLLCLLFRTICNLSPPPTGWDNEPPSEDCSATANMARIAYLRKSVLRHVNEAKLDASSFEKLWQDISKALVDMGADQNDVAHLRKNEFSEEGASYVERLSEWELEEEEMSHVDPMKPIIRRRSSLLDDIQQLRRGSKRDSITPMSPSLETFVELDFRPDINRLMGLCETDIDRLAGLYEKDTRQTLLTEVELWMEERDSERVLLVTGVAGSGKSVLSAVICKNTETRGCLAAGHFYQQDNSLYTNPRRVLRSLAQQLCTNVPWFQTKLIDSLRRNGRGNLNCLSTKELFSVLFEEPFKHLSDPGRNFILVLEGLDESRYLGRYEILNAIVNYFSILPSWVKLFVTTQLQDEILERLNESLHLKVLKSDDAMALEDIKLYYERRLQLQLQESAQKGQILQRLADESCGVFLYARLIADHLSRHETPLTPESVDSLLPTTINEVCEDYFKIMRSKLNTSEQVFADFLCAVSAAVEPLPMKLASKLLDLQDSKSQEDWRDVFCSATENFTQILHINQERLHMMHKLVVDSMPSLPTRRTRGNSILSKLCEGCLEGLKQRRNVYLEELSKGERYALRNYLHHVCGIQDDAEDSKELAQMIANNLLDVEIASAKLLIRCDLAEELQYFLGRLSLAPEDIENLETLRDCVHFYDRLGSTNIHLFLQIVSRNEKCPDLAVEAEKLINSGKFRQGVTLNPKGVISPADETQGLYVITTFPTSLEIVSLSVSPNDEYLACACLHEKSTSICLWSISGRTPRWRRAPISAVLEDNITFSPDGNMVLSGSLTHAHRVADGKRVEFFPMSNHKFRRCVYSQDRKSLLTLADEDDSCLWLWDMVNGQQLLKFSIEGRVEALAFSACGQSLACVTRTVDETKRHRRTLSLWRLHSSDAEKVVHRDVSPASICTLTFTPDSHHIVCGTDVFSVWGVGASGGLEETAVAMPTELEGANLTGIASNSTATTTRLLIFSRRNTFYLVQLESQDNTVCFKVLLAWSHESHSCARFAHVLSNRTCALVRYLYIPDVYVLTSIPTRVQQMSMSRDGATLGVLCDKAFTRFSLPGGEFLHRKEIIDEGTGDTQYLVETGDKPCSIISSWDGELKLWEIDAEDGYPHTVTERGHSVVNVKSLGDGRVVVRELPDLSKIRVWNSDTWQEEFSFDHQTDVLDFDVALDGDHIICCDVEQNITCWNVHTKTREWQTKAQHAEWVKVWPDERILVTGGHPQHHAINLWDRTTGELVKSLAGHASRVAGCASIRNGVLMVSFSLDKTLRVWKVVTGELVGFMQFQEPIESLMISNTKDHLALSFVSGEIRILEFKVPDCLLDFLFVRR